MALPSVLPLLGATLDLDKHSVPERKGWLKTPGLNT